MKKPVRRKSVRRPTRAPQKKGVRNPAAKPSRPAKRRKRPPAEVFLQQLSFQEESPAERKRTTYPVVEWADSSRLRMLTKLLRDLVRRNRVTAWRINFVHARSANLYAGKGFKVEDRLRAMREDVLVTVYRKFPDGTMGEATIPVVTDDERLAREELLQAAEVCEHVRRPAYELPEPADDLVFPQSADAGMVAAFQQGDELKLPHALHAQVQEILSEQDVIVNVYEILTTAAAVRVLNSNGVDVSYHKTFIYVEVTLAAREKGEEQEYQWHTVAVSPEQLNLRAALERAAQTARDSVRAVPNPGFTGDVLLSGQSLLGFFAPGESQNPLILHAFAKLHLMGIAQLKPGQPIGTFQGEPFTVSSDPRLPLGLLTAPVDEEGTPLTPVDIIRTGVFARHIATARYAQQLKVPCTGNMSNIHVGDGATREEHLRGNNYFEIVSFSWFAPDPFSGDFAAEVRLGYHWVNGRKMPFRGGTFTGNVFTSLLHARFSREVIQAGRYYGPRAILFKNALVTKRES